MGDTWSPHRPPRVKNELAVDKGYAGRRYIGQTLETLMVSILRGWGVATPQILGWEGRGVVGSRERVSEKIIVYFA